MSSPGAQIAIWSSGSTRGAVKAEWFVALAAGIAAAPVLFGFIVTRWVKYWNRADRSGGVV